MQANERWNNGASAKGFKIEAKPMVVRFASGTEFDGAEVWLRLDFTVEEALNFPSDLVPIWTRSTTTVP